MRKNQMSSNFSGGDISGVLCAKTVVSRVLCAAAALDGATALGKSNAVFNFNIYEQRNS